MRKVMTLVGTRPEIIKMSRVIAALDEAFDHVLVHSGQNYDYELNQVFFDDLGIRKPDIFLGVSGSSPSKSIANVIAAVDDVLIEEKPEAFLVYGDTNTGMAVVAAKRHKVPVFHMEAGNRCFDQRVPEELNRKVIDHLSDVNMVLTEHARRYLLAEGLRPELIFKTGSHMREVLDYYMSKVESSDILDREGLVAQGYFLVSAHREENVDDEETLKGLLAALVELGNKYGLPVLLSTHPRTEKRIAALGKSKDFDGLMFAKPFGFTDYLKLQTNAFCILSDSGTITEEASLLDLPAVTIRNAHERPEGMDEGTLVMSGLRSEGMLEAVRIVTDNRRQGQRAVPTVDDYESPAVSTQVVRIVASYIDYVNRTVWNKW